MSATAKSTKTKIPFTEEKNTTFRVEVSTPQHWFSGVPRLPLFMRVTEVPPGGSSLLDCRGWDHVCFELPVSFRAKHKIRLTVTVLLRPPASQLVASNSLMP